MVLDDLLDIVSVGASFSVGFLTGWGSARYDEARQENPEPTSQYLLEQGLVGALGTSPQLVNAIVASSSPKDVLASLIGTYSGHLLGGVLWHRKHDGAPALDEFEVSIARRHIDDLKERIARQDGSDKSYFRDMVNPYFSELKERHPNPRVDAIVQGWVDEVNRFDVLHAGIEKALSNAEGSFYVAAIRNGNSDFMVCKLEPGYVCFTEVERSQNCGTAISCTYKKEWRGDAKSLSDDLLSADRTILLVSGECCGDDYVKKAMEYYDSLPSKETVKPLG